MRKVTGMGHARRMPFIVLAASAAVLFYAAAAGAGDVAGKNYSGGLGKQCITPSPAPTPNPKEDIVLINDGRGTTKLIESQPSHHHHSFNFKNKLTATIIAKPYPGFMFSQWTVYGERDSVTLGSPTDARTTVTVKGVAVTIMATFQAIGGGTGGATGYPNTTGPGDNMQVDGSAVIGATNTDKTLETMTVNGRIKCDGLKIENWLFTQKAPPDYVFGKSYNLIDLERVEAYIKANGHLPEIPSAAEMQAKGVELGEFNMMLLKKIEELTLYTIGLKKELEKARFDSPKH
jgi:hypothetical protein